LFNDTSVLFFIINSIHTYVVSQSKEQSLERTPKTNLLTTFFNQSPPIARDTHKNKKYHVNISFGIISIIVNGGFFYSWT
jgi:hypothetical protein